MELNIVQDVCEHTNNSKWYVAIDFMDRHLENDHHNTLNLYVTHEYSCKFLCWKVTVLLDFLIGMLHIAKYLKTANFKSNRLIENICINQKELIHFAILQSLFACNIFYSLRQLITIIIFTTTVLMLQQ